MKAPRFWSHDGALARTLAPLSRITERATARRLAAPGYAPGIPVFCAGNASVGGTGKTILVLDLLRRLPGRPFALTRGYGGGEAGPLLVDPTSHSAGQVGDEALLLAAAAPTILARDRAAGARLALAEGATAVVMDDGLQNPGLTKSCAFLVIDGGYGFGNGRLLPAGPLREPVAAAAARCRAAVLIGADTTGAAAALPAGLPVLRAHLAVFCPVPLQDRAVFAFAGIGRPEKFFESVAGLGARIVGHRVFADHHAYARSDINRLEAAATRQDALLVTTAKDAVKLAPAFRARCAIVGVGLAWEDEAALNMLLR